MANARHGTRIVEGGRAAPEILWDTPRVSPGAIDSQLAGIGTARIRSSVDAMRRRVRYLSASRPVIRR